ncbi:hypothetical protein [Streptomyces naphthomycinicus]|nr:hypothetical protein [Streptomyces sp. TML10]
MNTAVTITLIVAAFLLGSLLITAVRDVAQAKHNPTRCPNCGHSGQEKP